MFRLLRHADLIKLTAEAAIAARPAGTVDELPATTACPEEEGAAASARPEGTGVAPVATTVCPGPPAWRGSALLPALAEAARSLEVPALGDQRGVLRDDAALLLDGLLVRVARGRGALEVALAERLAALATGDRTLRLGYSGLADYAREVLGVAGRTALALARLGRELATRPLLRDAVRAGEVSHRKAQAVLPVAVGAAEASWVDRARLESVRALEAAVRDAAGGGAGRLGDCPAGGAEGTANSAGAPGGRLDCAAVGAVCAPGAAGAANSASAERGTLDCAATGEAGGEPGEERWWRVELPVEPADRERFEEALKLAGRILGEGAPRWQRLEAVCQEYLGAHGDETEEGDVDGGVAGGGPGGGAADLDAAWRDAGRSGLPTDLGRPEARWRSELAVALERETERWSFLTAPPPLPAPATPASPASLITPASLTTPASPTSPTSLTTPPGPAESVAPVVPPGPSAPEATRGAGLTALRSLDAELRELAAMREQWDDLVGHLALLVRRLGLWRDLRFASFSHYCSERLGLPVRSVEGRIGLERRLHELPALREAMLTRRLSYEKARIVASVAVEGDVEAWVDLAERQTCVALRRAATAGEDAQRRARGELVLRVPERVAVLLDAALRAAGDEVGAAAVTSDEAGVAKAAGMTSDEAGVAEAAGLTSDEAGAVADVDHSAPGGRQAVLDGTAHSAAGRRRPSPSACLRRVAEHFLATWEALPVPRSTPQRRALERDDWHCQVPGCSRPAAHAHHVVYRSRGGADELTNLVALCAAHHLHGVHRAWVQVRGRAPAGLRWTLGEAAGRGVAA